MYRLDKSTTIFAPKYNLDSQVLLHYHSPPHVATVIDIPSYNAPNRYTVAFKDGAISKCDVDILSAMDDTLIQPTIALLPSWIKQGANATFIF
jgi:hypothetical protein